MSVLERLPQVCKGLVIEPEQVCELMGVKLTDTSNFETAGFPISLTLAGILEKELHASGRKWTCRALNGRVYILTDAEAMRFNQKRQRAGGRKFRRALTGYQGVDPSRLSSYERDELDRSHRVAAAQVFAIKEAEKRATSPDLGNLAAGKIKTENNKS